MPRKKSKKPSPQKALRNVTNQPKATDLTECYVKMKKLETKTVKGCVEKSKSLKRKIGTDENAGPPKKISETTPIPPAEGSLENLMNKYELLQKVISSKYVTVVDRLTLDIVPPCAENIEYCLGKHYKKAAPPKMPTTAEVNLLRNSVQQTRHKIFISLVWNLCQKEHFPGDVILTNIVKMILTLNPESKHNEFLQPILDQLVWLFDLILRKFPPCWLALRPSYMQFLRSTIEMSNLLLDKTLHANITIFEVVLMLLEDTVDDKENLRKHRRSRRLNNSSTSLTHFDDEYHNMQHWEKNDNEEQTFTALSKDTRLDRLMQVLHLIAKMLEMDLAMWMLRYHKNPTKHIYEDEDQPLVITLFSLSKYTRSSVLTKKVMTLFALCVEKDLDESYLKIMERFISLLANIQNLCEIQSTPAGIRYPYIGPATTSFTLDFFKTTEVNMKKDVNTYMRLIKTLRCPFVRYEYIDLFLNRLNPSPGKMCPHKIIENFRKNRWLECQSDNERQTDTSYSSRQSIVYRQNYLKILLEALRSYCDFHGTKEYLHEVKSTETKTEIHPGKPQKMTKKIDLSKMSKKITKLEAKVDMSMKLRASRYVIPVVNIRVNSELFSQYRNDIKYCMILHAYISTLQREHDEDFSQLIGFLKDFAPKN